ncbi:hypothetical protein Pyn_14954 [Prunus yedoensis var. nudiflora]|uniref:Uncharacterized protein n=1 Tax=Prunus yedoensis var. nudiflora TaxID=2094558 RepID=A0A314ZNM2_PRUYE|nr:hypothetical protein Pyn_14954 [Prunus yedoensis var. nudiflora]
MAPKKSSTSAPDTSSSGTASTGPAFLSGAGVKDFAAVFYGWVERFAAGRAQFLLCEDSISFVNDHCILGPRYLDQKSDQLWNYEVHPVRAPIPACRKGGLIGRIGTKCFLSSFQKLTHRVSNFIGQIG